MISKNELLEGLELLYTGKAFKGFREENPFVTFLKMDKARIWVKYGRKKLVTSLKNVALKSERLLLTPQSI